MPSIDLNCDLGESFGAYTIGMDAEILPYVTSANIACGFHAGDPSVMQKSVLLCKKYGVQVGAHPGLPDLQGFGRRRMAISPAEAEADVMYQIGALKAFCDAAGVPLHHVKPHGALYNMAARDPVLAAAICRAVQAAAPGAVLLALSGASRHLPPRGRRFSICLPKTCLPPSPSGYTTGYRGRFYVFTAAYGAVLRAGGAGGGHSGAGVLGGQ
mgnify:CR=1 FL=1